MGVVAGEMANWPGQVYPLEENCKYLQVTPEAKHLLINTEGGGFLTLGTGSYQVIKSRPQHQQVLGHCLSINVLV